MGDLEMGVTRELMEGETDEGERLENWEAYKWGL